MDQDKLIEILDRIANALEVIVEHLDKAIAIEIALTEDADSGAIVRDMRGESECS